MKTKLLIRRCLCVDPGLGGTGWAYFDNREEPIQHGVIHAYNPRKQIISWEKRAMDIVGKFQQVIYSVDRCIWAVIEFPGLFGGAVGHASSAKGDTFKLAFLVGLMAGACKFEGLDFKLLTPMEWKGQLPKKVVDIRIYNRLGKKYPNHVADAVGMGLHLMGGL